MYSRAMLHNSILIKGLLIIQEDLSDTDNRNSMIKVAEFTAFCRISAANSLLEYAHWKIVEKTISE